MLLFYSNYDKFGMGSSQTKFSISINLDRLKLIKHFLLSQINKKYNFLHSFNLSPIASSLNFDQKL
jgi:hypothetical protein